MNMMDHTLPVSCHVTEAAMEEMKMEQIKTHFMLQCRFSPSDVTRFFWVLKTRPLILIKLYKLRPPQGVIMRRKDAEAWPESRIVQIFCAATIHGPESDRLHILLEKAGLVE